MDKYTQALFGALTIGNGLYAAFGHGRWKTLFSGQQQLQQQVNQIALQTPPAPAPVPTPPTPKPVPVLDPPGTQYVMGPNGAILRVAPQPNGVPLVVQPPQ
jgi:hypothetical protein